MRETKVTWWMVLIVLLGVAIYALAEDLTLTTYYPSPRGVYKELRASESVAIGATRGPWQPGSSPLPAHRLLVAGQGVNRVDQLTCPAGTDWYNEDSSGFVDDGECKPTVLVTPTGQVGIGTTSPNTALDLAGALSVRGMAAPAVAPSGQGRLYFDASANKFQVSEHGGAYRNLGGTSWQSWTLVGSYNATLNSCLGINCDTGIAIPDDKEVFYAVVSAGDEIALAAPAIPAYALQGGSNGSLYAGTCLYFHPGLTPNDRDHHCGISYDLYSVTGTVDVVQQNSAGSGHACTLAFNGSPKTLTVRMSRYSSAYNVDCFVAVWQR